MGHLEMPGTLPDTFGLPEYFITDIVTEIDGPNVRVICGARRGGVVHWLYSAVMPADRLMSGARLCNLAALEAVDLQWVMAGKGH